MKNLSVAILTGTLNPNLTVFRRCLEAIKSQKYQGKIVHYILDGGSNKQVLDLAREYHCQIIKFPNHKDEGLNRIIPTLPKIKEDLILFLESDNIMTSRDWLSRMVEPFKYETVFSTYSMHNAYEKSDNMLTKYFALVGSPDPTLYYLAKSDKIRMDQVRYDKGKILKDTKNFSIVQFTSENLPVMGDNGFLIRTDVCKKIKHTDASFYHTDVYAQLVSLGYNTVGVVKNSIIHISPPNIMHQVHRRVEVKEHFTDEIKSKRKYFVYNPQSKHDRQRLILFVLFSITFIQPLMVSIRGYNKIHEKAWFLHPIMCLLMVMAYGKSEIMRMIKNI
jgi:hypothetical protein